MAKRKLNLESFEVLGEVLEPPPVPTVKVSEHRTWKPKLTPRQEDLFVAEEKFILCWGPKGGSKCTTADALVYTDGGLKRLGRMRPENAQVGDNPILAPVKAFDGVRIVDAVATNFWVEPGREAMRCELENGSEMTGSPRHPLWTCAELPDGTHKFGYVSLKDMQELKAIGWRFWTPFVENPGWGKKELVVVETLLHRSGNFTWEQPRKVILTENLAYALGALVGDGSMNLQKGDNRSIGFTNEDPECVFRVRAGVEELGCKLEQVRSSAAYQYQVQPASKIKPLIKALGIGHLSYDKFIPDAIIESPKPVIAAFLRGLFDTDGWVTGNGKVSFCSVSHKLIVGVQEVLAAFGILAVRRNFKSASGRKTWRMQMTGRAALKFREEVGFEISRKMARIRGPEISKRCPSGFNQNYYGYPNPIKKVMRQAWHEAEISKTRKENKARKALLSFGSIPSREKVQWAIREFKRPDLFEPFLISDHWLEVEGIEKTEAELFDLSVPGPSSFLASGRINHNTYGLGNKALKHAWENDNAFVLMVVRVSNMALKGGMWDILINEVIPRWREGNMDRDGNKFDDGFGLVHSAVGHDQNHCPFIWILNKYNKWSLITVMSAPHADQLRDRIKSVVPSLVLLDEVTSCDSDIYFSALSAQLGRRPRVKGVQQFIGATNPDDPEHWSYKRWFEDCFDEETGVKNPKYRDIYFPAELNKENLQPGYLEGLADVYGKNSTEAQRMIGGQWVAVPSGESLFLEMYNEALHVKPVDDLGRPSDKGWLMPSKDYPMIIGVDSGMVHHAFIFMQRLPLDGRMKWFIFDEVVLLRRPLKYGIIMLIMARRIRWWLDTVGAWMPQVWISDNSAFKMFRPGQGTYDSLDMERNFNAVRDKYRLEKLKIREAPKFSGSVEASLRIEQTALMDEEIIISARCKKVRAMYNRLESEKQKPGQPFDPKLATTPRRSDHLHVFAAGVYPKLAASIQPSILVPVKPSLQTLVAVRAA